MLNIMVLFCHFLSYLFLSLKPKGAFGCSGGMVMGIIMVIRMEWNMNTDFILLFGCILESIAE